jgi:hypothetical protein
MGFWISRGKSPCDDVCFGLGETNQQHAEQVFRGLKDGEWLGWEPMYPWTDQKIRVHAFYCMLGISLLQQVRR